MKAVREKLRRALSLTLAFAMTLSLFSAYSFSWAAQAAEELSPYSNSANAMGDSQKPKLYIDFLGDDTGLHSVGAVPTNKDQSAAQSGGLWNRYASPADEGTVFWVGVGIDKMKLFELAKDGRGLTGLELGFYYNTEFVEPYTGSDYAQTLTGANLSANPDPLNQWDSGVYHIEQAIPDRDPVFDGDTQELLSSYPDNTDMQSGDWRMLYVSLEKNEDAWNAPNRFHDSATADDGSIYYVMMLPFVLKKYDPQDRICFRLSRNASVFSMGGSQYGAGIYDSANDETASFGAWERETRTPRHNLKEMFTFEGDLNIFTGLNEPDGTYNARLQMIGHQNVNGAKLYPSDDPSVYVDENGGLLSGLTPGSGLTLEVTPAAGFYASVTVVGGTSDTSISTVEVSPGEKYTFVMPSENVIVTVRYFNTLVDADQYRANLVIEGDDALAENAATLTGADAGGTVNSTSTTGTYIYVKPGDPTNPADIVDVTVENHPDYTVKVTVATMTGNNIAIVGPDDNGHYIFVMPTADVEVKVTYEKLPAHNAELAVDNDPNGSVNNKARLSYVDYSGAAPVTNSVMLNGRDGGHEVNLGPIPVGRTVTLDIALDPDYAVTEVSLYDKNGGVYTFNRSLLPLSLKDPVDGIYILTTSFDMPDNVAEVYVKFEKAADHKAVLVLENGKSAEMTGKKGASDVDTGNGTLNSTDMSHTPFTPGVDDTILVWGGNTVRVDLAPESGYAVDEISVTYDDPSVPGGKVTVPYLWDGLDTSPVTFSMPNVDVTVTVKFKEVPKDTYNATLVPNSTNAIDAATTGWQYTTIGGGSSLVFPTLQPNEAGDLLTGQVQVKPGYYIASVTVV